MLLTFLRGTAIVLGALALAASWLDVETYATAWIGLVLLFVAIAGLGPRQAFAAGFLFGVIYIAVALNWAPHMLALTLNSDTEQWKPWLVFLAIASWEAIPFAALSSAVTSAAGGAIPVWLCAGGWIAMERFWPRVFPWSLAHTQIGFPPMVQVAELGGIYLVSFAILYFCIGIGVQVSRRDFTLRFASCVPLLLVVFSLVFGWYRLASFEDSEREWDTIRVGVAQFDPRYIDATKKMRLASEQLQPVDLLLWPESTLGTYSTAVKGLDEIRRDIKIAHMPFLDWKQARGLGAWLLAGGKTFEPGASVEGPYYQTAYLVDTDGEFRGRYYKRALMPIGEYMPLEHKFPELHDWAQLSQQAAWGTSDTPLKVKDGVPVGVLLCYEDIVAEMSRRSVAEGAELLVSLINASAFEDPLALEQHLRLATLRSVENRRTLIRCSGTGVSACIAPTGKVLTQLPTHTEGQFAVDAQLNSGRTIYNRVGYLLPHLAAVAVGYAVLKAHYLTRYAAKDDAAQSNSQ